LRISATLFHAVHAPRLLERLVHQARHAAFQPALDFVYHLGVRLAHVGDAADDGQLPLGGQAFDDLRPIGWRQVREDQGDRLGMLVDDERHQVLRIDLFQEAERQGLDRLANDVERLARPAAQGLFHERLGQVNAAPSQAERAGVAVGELVDHRLLLFGGQAAQLGDFDRDLLDLLGPELRHELRRLLLGQAHQQDRSFADVGHAANCRAVCAASSAASAAASALARGVSAKGVRLSRPSC
jgi:hypothetical protein